MDRIRWRIIVFSYLNNFKGCIKWELKNILKAQSLDFLLRSFISKEPRIRTRHMNNLLKQNRQNLRLKNSLLSIDLRRLLDRI